MAEKQCKQKSWTKMTAEELAEATKQFETPMRFETTRPMTAAQLQKWHLATDRSPMYSLRARRDDPG
jgi:hypothetical protein